MTRTRHFDVAPGLTSGVSGYVAGMNRYREPV